VVRQRPARYDLGELAEWLSETYLPLLVRKDKPASATVGESMPYMRFVNGARMPINTESRLAQMRHQGPGDSSIHRTQLSVSASLLKRGEAPERVVEKVLAATKAIGNPSWDWAAEQRKIEGLTATWLEKQPQTATNTTGEAPPVIQFYWQVISDFGLSPIAFKVAFVIGQRWHQGAGGIWPSQETIAVRIGVHRQAVNKAIGELIASGHVRQLPYGGGRGATIQYEPILRNAPPGTRIRWRGRAINVSAKADTKAL
jgi:Helix-turn-helix domain